jgi:predicted ATP-grasp superfamily ATP-dependent carboligase
MERSGALVIEGHVQGLSNTRSLGEAGVPVYVADTGNCLARYSRYCRKFLKCPAYDNAEFPVFLAETAEREQIDGWLLLPSNDHAVYNIAKNADLLREKYRLITPDIEIIDRIYNKQSLIAAAMKCELPVPQSWFPGNSVTEIIDGVTFPCLVKGKKGLNFYRITGKKAFPCNSEKELKRTVSILEQQMPIQEIFVQELLPTEDNKTVSFAAFALEGNIVSSWAGIKVREHPLHFGTSTYSKSISRVPYYSLAERLLKELNYTGICEIEFLNDPRDREYKLIEVNARTWLWVDLARKCGVDFALYAYNYANGVENKYSVTSDTNKEWMHYLTDIPYSILGLLKGNYSIEEILISYYRRPAPAVFRKSDFLPTLAELLLLPSMIRKR